LCGLWAAGAAPGREAAEADPLPPPQEFKIDGKGELPPPQAFPKNEESRVPTREEIQAEREKGREILREEALEKLTKTWEQTADSASDEERRSCRAQALAEYESEVSRWYGVNPNNHTFEIADSEEMKRSCGSWNGRDRTLKVNAELLDLDSPDEAVATVKHELSHCHDEQRGQAPEHYFQEQPEAPHPDVQAGKLKAGLEDTPEMKDAAYEEYAEKYEEYLANWDKISEEDIEEKYVTPPEPPIEPAPGSENAESRYEQLCAHCSDAFHKYERSAGERQARQRERQA